MDPYSVQNAGWNAADSAALRIRQSITIPNIRVFSIGLGNSGGVPADFLERVANDVRASNFDGTYPTGNLCVLRAHFVRYQRRAFASVAAFGDPASGKIDRLKLNGLRVGALTTEGRPSRAACLMS